MTDLESMYPFDCGVQLARYLAEQRSVDIRLACGGEIIEKTSEEIAEIRRIEAEYFAGEHHYSGHGDTRR